MNPQAIQTLFDYHYDMWDVVWGRLMELSQEQFVLESDYSWRTVRNHIFHVISTDDRWLARVQGQSLPNRLEPSMFVTQDSVRATWNDVRDRVRHYVYSLNEAELLDTLTVNLAHRGGEYHNLRWEILAHMVNHGTDHRAQVLARLHELGITTVEQDMILYLWERQRL